ncbi:MAG: FtsX-like permease family protein [Alphaproteobacteria bacterium]|nr:FtsX-like permease family protein [Alphaproteobacteria bacterium]
MPTQQGELPTGADGATAMGRGEADYQAMRLATRLAASMTFLIGAIIVFYTMRFSVAARAREFCLLLCLGERRSGAAAALVLEAAWLGGAGVVLGCLGAVPIGAALLRLGISTTGRRPLPGFEFPAAELTAIAVLGLAITLLGVAGPVWRLTRMRIADILHPRFLSEDLPKAAAGGRSFAWLLPLTLALTYLAVRPLLIAWMSVLYFFLVEAAVLAVLAGTLVWCVQPLLHLIIRAAQALLRPILPIESLLAARHLIAVSRQSVMAIAGIALVFGLLLCLSVITRSLKQEIRDWGQSAVEPFAYFRQTTATIGRADETVLAALRREGYYPLRLSDKAPGGLPLRVVAREDLNLWRRIANRRPLTPGTAIFSRALAARHGLTVGDLMVFVGERGRHPFEIIDITDQVGFDLRDGPYIEMKSFALVPEGSPIYRGNLDYTLGRHLMVRRADGRTLSWRQSRYLASRLFPTYRLVRRGRSLIVASAREITRDFFIFDFILALTVVLAAVGVGNTMLIQVLGRAREFAVLRAIGLDGRQVRLLLLTEGLCIGCTAAVFALVLGNALGAVSIAFLDHFTLFEYRYTLSAGMLGLIVALAIATCAAAALYPARLATRTNSAESLHYE